MIVRLWPYLLALAALLTAGVWLRHAGYEAGHAASEKRWRPAFEAADKERIAANARATALEAASIGITKKVEDDYAATFQTLRARSDAADGRVRELLRDAALSARSREVRPVSEPAARPDDPQPFLIRPDTLANGAGAIFRDCEADSAQLDALRAWVSEQLAILR